MGLEPMTSPLPRECSTTELQERTPTTNRSIEKLGFSVKTQFFNLFLYFYRKFGAGEGTRTLGPQLGRLML